MSKKTKRSPGRPPIDPKLRRRRCTFSLAPAAIRLLRKRAKTSGDSQSRTIERLLYLP